VVSDVLFEFTKAGLVATFLSIRSVSRRPPMDGLSKTGLMLADLVLERRALSFVALENRESYSTRNRT